MRMKNSFSLLEIILLILLISIITTLFIPKQQHSNLDLAADRIVTYLKYTRNLALNDNRFDHTSDNWHRQRWTLKFLNCWQSVGGLYFIVVSDRNKDNYGYPFKKVDCAKDPLTNKYLYSHGKCGDHQDNNKYVQLTREYGVTEVKISCNTTDSIGQITFGNDGRVYSKFGKSATEFEIKEKCFIELFENEHNSKIITIEPTTGYIHR